MGEILHVHTSTRAFDSGDSGGMGVKMCCGKS